MVKSGLTKEQAIKKESLLMSELKCWRKSEWILKITNQQAMQQLNVFKG